MIKTSKGDREVLLAVAQNVGLHYKETITLEGHTIEVVNDGKGFRHTFKTKLNK